MLKSKRFLFVLAAFMLISVFGVHIFLNKDSSEYISDTYDLQFIGMSTDNVRQIAEKQGLDFVVEDSKDKKDVIINDINENTISVPYLVGMSVTEVDSVANEHSVTYTIEEPTLSNLFE